MANALLAAFQPNRGAPLSSVAVAAAGDVITPEGSKPHTTPKALDKAGIAQVYVHALHSQLAHCRHVVVSQCTLLGTHMLLHNCFSEVMNKSACNTKHVGLAAEQVIEEFRQAARNAVDAGFHGVEIHSANVRYCTKACTLMCLHM